MYPHYASEQGVTTDGAYIAKKRTTSLICYRANLVQVTIPMPLSLAVSCKKHVMRARDIVMVSKTVYYNTFILNNG